MLSGKVVIICLISGQIKDSIKMSQYFPKSYEHYSGNVNVELYLIM